MNQKRFQLEKRRKEREAVRAERIEYLEALRVKIEESRIALEKEHENQDTEDI